MPKQFSIIIVGAGLSGLGAAIGLRRKGHDVTVIEGATQLNDIGAGIQTPPNSTRVLVGYGLEKRFLEDSVRPNGILIRRWENGEVLGSNQLYPSVSTSFFVQ